MKKKYFEDLPERLKEASKKLLNKEDQVAILSKIEFQLSYDQLVECAVIFDQTVELLRVVDRFMTGKISEDTFSNRAEQTLKRIGRVTAPKNYREFSTTKTLFTKLEQERLAKKETPK